MNIFKANFPIFDLVYGAILIYMAISCLISIMISHFKFLKIIIGQPASHGACPPLVEQGWRGEGAPRPRAAAWRRARPGKSRDRTPPDINTNAINKVTMYERRLGRPQVPVAEGGPVGFSDGGTDGTGSPGPGGWGRPKRRPNGDVILTNASILAWHRKKNCLR